MKIRSKVLFWTDPLFVVYNYGDEGVSSFALVFDWAWRYGKNQDVDTFERKRSTQVYKYARMNYHIVIL